jgi:hypothetical protein
MYPEVHSPSGRCAFEVDRQPNQAAADNATAHEAPRMLEQLRRQLEIPTGDVVDPLDGPSPAHPTRRRQDEVSARTSPHRSRDSSQIRAPWPNCHQAPRQPAGDQEHPCQASLPQKLHRTSNPDTSSRIDPSVRSSTASSLAWATHHWQMNIPMGRASTEYGGQAQKAGPGPRDSPHLCRTYGVARPAERPVSTAVDRRSLIRPPWPGPPRGMRIGQHARPSSALGAAEPVGTRAIFVSGWGQLAAKQSIAE